MKRLENKVAIITGAAKGMGKSEAQLFAEEGAIVIATDVDDKMGQETVEDITSKGGKAEYYHLDVAQENEWQDVIKQVVSQHHKVDVLVNNAGILIMESVEETSTEDWDKIFDINAKGVFFGCKYVAPAMRKAGGGSIINISSVYGLIGAPNAAAYEATKGAVRLLTKAAASDYATDNIRVNSVHPGLIDTPMVANITKDPERTKAVLCTTLFERAADPMEVARPVLMLASDDSSYMTGSELVVDGGYTAR